MFILFVVVDLFLELTLNCNIHVFIFLIVVGVNNQIFNLMYSGVDKSVSDFQAVCPELTFQKE